MGSAAGAVDTAKAAARPAASIVRQKQDRLTERSLPISLELRRRDSTDLLEEQAIRPGVAFRQQGIRTVGACQSAASAWHHGPLLISQ